MIGRILYTNKEAFDSLLTFYKAYRNWLNADAPQKRPFIRSDGLCHSCMAFHLSNSDLGFTVLRLMKEQFKQAKLDVKYPFGRSEFIHSLAGNNMHTDVKRIKWVEDKIVEMESKS